MTSHADIARGELIGLAARVDRAANPSLRGLAGVVVDETRHFLMLETQAGRKRVPKEGCVFRFRVGEREIEIDGRDIAVAPEERIKRKAHHDRR